MADIETRVSTLEGKMEEHSALIADLLRDIREGRDETARQFGDLRADISRQFDTMQRQCETMQRMVEALQTDMARRFDHVDARFQQVDGRFQQIEGRFAQIDTRFLAIDEKIDRHFVWVIGTHVAVLLAVVGALVGSYYR